MAHLQPPALRPAVGGEPTPRPWHHESAGPAWFNEWTWAHLAWGMWAARYFGPLEALLLHTVYETIEGELFPMEDRDVSMQNHLGDTTAFMAGWYVMRGS